MTDDDEGWDDLFAPAPASPSTETPVNLTMDEDDWVARARSDDVARAPEPAPDSVGQAETGATSASDDTGALTLFGDHDQFHVAWSHWRGMPEFHMDNLSPDSTVVVKFRTPEDRAAFAKLIGREIRAEESRGIWYPAIQIASFWNKAYFDATATADEQPPALTSDDEVEDESESEGEEG